MLSPAERGPTKETGMRLVGRLVTLAAGLLLFASSAQAAGVSGKWTAEFDTQVGQQKYTFDLKVDGETLTGKAFFERMGQKGEADILEGKVKGDTVSFVEMLEFEGNKLRIEYTGTLKGDEISFKRLVGDFATEEFVARRAKE
jgi:hypothetical protein